MSQVELEKTVIPVKQQSCFEQKQTEQIQKQYSKAVISEECIKVQQQSQSHSHFQEPPKQAGKRMPTSQELVEALVLIKKLLPHRDPVRVITNLRQTLIQRNSSEQGLASRIPGSSSEITHFYTKQQLLQTQFASSVEEVRYKQKRLIAKAFVSKGYGLQHALDECKRAKFNASHLSKDYYKLRIGQIASLAFNNLEKFLSQDCKKIVEPITREQLRKVMTQLLKKKSQDQNKEELVVLKLYFRLSYGLSSVTLKEKQSVQFYEKVMKPLRGEQLYGQKDSKITVESKKIGKQTDQNKSQLAINAQEVVETYIQYKSLRKTAQILNIHLQKISDILVELVQKGIKRIQNSLNKGQRQQYQLLTEQLTYQQIAYICKIKQAQDSRIHILSILQQENIKQQQAVSTLEKVRNIISKMKQNNPCHSIESSDQEIHKEKEEVIQPQSQKHHQSLEVYHEDED